MLNTPQIRVINIRHRSDIFAWISSSDRGHDVSNKEADDTVSNFGGVYEDLDYSGYTLIESPGDNFDDDFRPQVCDMVDLQGSSAGRDRFVNLLGTAMEDVGIAILINHGIGAEELQAIDTHALNIFTTTPDQQKMRFVSPDCAYGEPYYLGYVPLQECMPSLPHAVEAWEFDRSAFRIPGEDGDKALDHWPDAKFEAEFRRFWQACEELTPRLGRALLRYLDVDPSLYDEKIFPTNDVLRINHYPPISTAAGSLASPARVLAHEDYGLISLMLGSPIEGLQVYSPRSKAWSRVHTPADSLVVISGEWLRFISGDRFRACTHRVSVPRDPAQRAAPRVTVLYTLHPFEASVVEVLPGLQPNYQPISGRGFMTRVADRLSERCRMSTDQF
ncbi:Isopenicillin N synthase [Nocardia amikacinitolerans]|uniref:Isopenicillin N synthase n=1 Tax=Nocardia amikacinitolerans TaxID=756689 RepID=A0A285L2M4_9NOCA|nr:2OG-Fe(II) oxygenase family protein [Nocardia amikacinitolerans]MCP2296745.1 Isopenicillin N synthase [Nocardia amikacinitolerans]SNY78733.1 Isopenicillin N synthase [Nocardia amikacinitolerans]